ncbi:Xaa-Pro aminopeptidase [Bacillus thermophilus]|uniref:Xaa-Pro aminopeptidase n=1 Tax=Siminovitchia thermophila TaxID=1245522 RepID=A0ABS2R5D2_9BACI|nr:Xaa-Pro peptidase family protein [Siminovitchia thermophila]MBM7714831.1 Xaa-Pro aminopeptidase [Siminovitchia thermophila]ONK21717.1 hypothetical protein BLX87_19685 [Bacillus sp. VT-16-64]
MNEFQKRIEQFAKRMKQEHIDASILFDQSHIRYFSGFIVNQVTESVLIIESDGTVSYLVPRLDFYRAERDCWIEKIESFLEDTPDYLAPLRKIVNKNWQKIGIEQNIITVRHLSYIKDICKGNLTSVDLLLEDQMKIKSEWEIANLRQAANIASLTMDETKRYISENTGVTEREASGYAKYIMNKNGAENVSFEPFIMSGLDAALPRRISTNKVLTEGELILFDMGCIYNGYCSDITRTFSLGQVSDKQKEVFEIALEAQKKAVKAIKPGEHVQTIDAIARDYITEHGYGEYFPHLTGHGLGMAVHEYPILDQGEKSILQKNMIVTIEPGVYMPGVGAARMEDMILVTDSGYEYLTTSSRVLLLK